MGWVVLVRICYDGDQKKVSGMSSGTVTSDTKQVLEEVGLHLSTQNTGLYHGYFDKENEAKKALSKLVERLFELGGKVTLDHTMMTVIKAGGPLPPVAATVSGTQAAGAKPATGKKTAPQPKGGTAKTQSTSARKTAKASTKKQ